MPFIFISAPVRKLVAALTRQRMNKSGTYTSPTGWNVVPGWSPDVSFPATIVGDKIQVQGAGEITISALVQSTGGGGDWNRLRLMHNGTQLALYENNGGAGWTSPYWSINRTVSAGDTIWIESQRQAFSSLSVNTGTYLDVLPIASIATSGAYAASGSASTSVTVDQDCMLVVAQSTLAGVTTSTVKVDGVAMTLAGADTVSGTRLYYAMVSSGTRTVVATPSSGKSAIAVSAYSGATSVSGATVKAGSVGTLLSLAPSGSGTLVVSCYHPSSDGPFTPKAGQMRATNIQPGQQMAILLADGGTTPSFSSSSTAWGGVSMWLN